MAIAQWEITNPIDYSANGDDIDTFAQKTKQTFEQTFLLLNKLNSNGAAAGLDETDATPYSIRVNTADNCIYMRNGDNTDWIILGRLEPYYGIVAKDIGGIVNGGKMGKLSIGNDINKPKTAETYDFYFAYDTSRLYVWTGYSWKVFLSLQFGDLLDYEKYCVQRSDVDYNGADKILRLDKKTGKANVDITGSPEKIFDKQIDFQNLRDGHAIVYNAEKDKFVNLPNWTFTQEDTTFTGGKTNAKKLLKVSEDGTIHIDVTGSATKIGGVPVETKNFSDGQVFVYKDGYLIPQTLNSLDTIKFDISKVKDGETIAYDATQKKFKPVSRSDLSEDELKTIVEKAKLPTFNEDGVVPVSISGSAAQVDGVKFDLDNVQDGQIMVYHSSTKTFKNEGRGAVGEGKSLILKDGNKILGDYNGAETKTLNLAEILDKASTTMQTNHLSRLMANLYLGLNVANLTFGGCDNMVMAAFKGDYSIIDDTAVKATSLMQGDDSIDVESSEKLIVGAIYILSDGVYAQDVKIKYIGGKRIMITENVAYPFNVANTKFYRSGGSSNGKMNIFATKIIKLSKEMQRANLVIKHGALKDCEIDAWISIRPKPNEVKSEFLTVGKTGLKQSIKLKHTNKLTTYGFRLYFDVAETFNYELNTSSGTVEFTAPVGQIVTVDYNYNFAEENFKPMTKIETLSDIDSFACIFNE